MNASTVPFEAASKHSNGGMIWPPGKTSIRNRPPLISSTTVASRWAAPCRMSIAGVHAVDIRQWTFGWAMTLAQSVTVAAATATTAPLAVTMNLRRSGVTLASLRCHELMVGALGDPIPGAHQRLELREGRVHLPGHGSPLGFLSDNLGGELFEIAEHRHRKLENLDHTLELRLEPLKRNGVLHVVVREAIYLHCGNGMVESPPQINRERLVRLLVEAELVHIARLLPTRIVVVARCLVEAQLHVVMRSHPFAGIDHSPLERGIDLRPRNKHRRAAGLDIDLPAEARTNAHL